MNWKLFFVLFFIGLIYSSCDNTLDLFEEPKEIPIVYGLLSPAENEQFIRIERAFVDPNVPAEILAQEPDELYYSQVDAFITNQRTGLKYPLTRVNAEDEGYIRDEGFFAKSPNYVYKLNVPEGEFKGGDFINFNMTTGESGENPVQAELQLVDTIRLFEPRFADHVISIIEDTKIKTQWGTVQGSLNPPKLWDVNYYINIEEADISLPEPEWIPKTLKWELGKNIVAKESEFIHEYLRDGTDFYTFMATSLEALPNINRQIIDIDIEIITSGNELQKYIDVITANTGVTSSQVSPNYTNIEGGLGLLAERNIERFDQFFATDFFKKNLKESDITKDLNFR